MKIIVCIKQICHTYARTGMDPEQNFLSPEDKVYRVNPYDEVAMELALCIKESLNGGDIIILTLGSIIAETELRRCLAMGANHLYQIEVDGSMDSWRKSGLLARAIKDMDAGLILCGKESLDNQNGQVGAFIAHHLGIPFVSAIRELTISKDKRSSKVNRSAGRGIREVIECPLPAVFSVDLGLHETRLPAYEHKKQARSHPIQKLSFPEEFIMPKIISAKVFPPRPRSKKVITPDSRLGSYDRIKQLLIGSRVEKKGVILRGSPKSQAEGILSFLKRHGFLKSKNGLREG